MNKERLFRLLAVCIMLVSLYEFLPALYVSQSTGSLEITSLKPHTYLTIDQPGKQAINVGIDVARVRLRPGTYQVTATSGLAQSVKNVLVVKKKLFKISVNPSSSSSVPTNYTIAEKLIGQLLPFTGPGFEYQIGYKYNFINSVAQPVITITAPSSQAQQAAVAWIKGQGYNPSALDITYIVAQP